MKSKIIKNVLIGFGALLPVIYLSSCTKLDVKLKDPYIVEEVGAGEAPQPSSLSKVYEQLNNLVGQEKWYALEEHTSDEMLGPTRGTDWDDFGVWRKLHLHTWDASHSQINNAWNDINSALFQTTLLAEYPQADAATKAEARFLRAFFSYLACDLFGQVQHRPATAANDVIPEVYTRTQAIDFIISELEAVIPQLGTYTSVTRNKATKEAAQFLLAKCYLNKAVFKQDPQNPAGPYTFDAGDMNKVISLCNSIIANPALSLNDDYWNNFIWTNSTTGTENIFVRQKSQGIDLVWATAMGFHYNQRPSGWNGFTTLADFYDSFEDGDIRKKEDIPGYTNQVGSNAGFLIGQVKGPVDKIGDPIVNLKDRTGSPLIFTKDVSIYFSSEAKGIRVVKYPLDPATINGGGGDSKNEFVFFRLSDAMLMKAEAILRGGTDAQTPLQIVNAIRVKRHASAFASVDLKALLAERGRELYYEGWRRNDMIRFGVFNDPVGERPEKSEAFRVVFPIPNIALTSNPNLKQNFGYK